MKVAILYSGLMRNLAETIHNNLEYFQYLTNDIDLYFSIWDNIGYADQINAPDNIKTNRILGENIKITEDVIRGLVPRNINIKKIKIEKYHLNNCQLDLINGIDNLGLPGQFYKVLDCFDLLDSSINYDVIVRLRCDILLNNKMSSEYLLQSVADKKIIFASKIWYNYTWEPGIRCINDMIWVSNTELMKKSCSIYKNVNKINNIISNRNQTNINHGESICFMNLEAEDITNNIETFDFDYIILR